MYCSLTPINNTHHRADLFDDVQQNDETVITLSDQDKLKILMREDKVVGTARLLERLYECRQSLLFRN